MTEQEAIERIEAAIDNAIDPAHGIAVVCMAARAAWNEMKAIARETPPNPVPAWRNSMTLEEARAELLRGQRLCPNPDDHYHYIDGHEMGQA